jgi:hypothetical protein
VDHYHEALDNLREMQRRREGLSSHLSQAEMDKHYTVDSYLRQIYFIVTRISLQIDNELEAMPLPVVPRRDILILLCVL